MNTCKGKPRRHAPIDESSQKQQGIHLVDTYVKNKDKPTNLVPGEYLICNYAAESALRLCRVLDHEKGKILDKSRLIELWSCGQNSYGELCHGDTTSRQKPCNVHFNDSIDVSKIATGTFVPVSDNAYL